MQPAVEIRNLHKSFKQLHVLRGIDLDVQQGEAVVLLGSSGSGKSTLLRCINFMEEPNEGQIRINGDLIGTERSGRMVYRESELCKLRTRVGMVFQHFNLFPHKTVLENVMEGQLVVLGRSKAEASEKAMLQLARVGLAEKAPEYPARLSGGQKQRVAIARALASEPKLLLADEPTGALDTQTSYEVMDIIQKINQEGKTILVVTHEEDIAQMCKRIVRLKDGVIVEDTKVEQVLAAPYVQ